MELVNPVPNTDNSTAEVFLMDDRLPPLEEWHKQFRRIVNGTYEMRGVEVTLKGAVEEREGNLFLASRGQRPYVRLAPLRAPDKVQWNHTIRERKPLEPDETLAYERLAIAVTGLPPGQQVTITGPLNQTPAGYQLYLRLSKF